MKKIFFIIAIMMAMCVNAQEKKYVIFNDSVSAVKKIDSINNVLLPVWKAEARKNKTYFFDEFGIKKLFFTTCYAKVYHIESLKKWGVEIIPKYEFVFTNEEKNNAIIFNENQ